MGVMLEIGILYDDNISRCLLDAIKAAPFPLFLMVNVFSLLQYGMITESFMGGLDISSPTHAVIRFSSSSHDRLLHKAGQS